MTFGFLSRLKKSKPNIERLIDSTIKIKEYIKLNVDKVKKFYSREY